MVLFSYRNLAQKSCKSISSFLAKLRQLNLMESIPDAKSNPTYYYEGPYRYVKNYHFTYKTFTKQRWIGQKLHDMFTKEFQAYTPEYYEKAILEGRIRVNKKQAELDYKLKNNDCIEHDAMRIEPPVYNTTFEIAYEDNDYIVINKPPSVPIHVCGSYFFNTVTYLMTYAFNYPKVYSVHRLDKLTSGLLVLAKTQDKAYKFQTELKINKISKLYLARVLGNFPCADGEELIVSKAIYCASAKIGRFDWAKNEEQEKLGKTAETLFKKLWYDEITNTSLIECRPLTGRTHQIRVHCNSLGCSIINDVCYGGVFIGNPYEDIVYEKLKLQKKAGTGAKEDEKEPEKKDSQAEVIKSTETAEDTKLSNAEEKLEKADFEPEVGKKLKLNEEKSDKIEAQKGSKEEEKAPDPEEAKEENKAQEIVDIREVNDEEQTYVMEIWLHSLRYQYKDQVFEASLPYWADRKVGFTIKDFKRSY